MYIASVAGIHNLFINSAVVILVITALAKLISICAASKIPLEDDPVFGFSYKRMLLLAAIVELLTAGFCFFSIQVKLRYAAITWLASTFGLYRLALLSGDYHKPCPCLGNLTDALHIQPAIADSIMFFLFTYLLIGGCIGMYLAKSTLAMPAFPDQTT